MKLPFGWELIRAKEPVVGINSTIDVGDGGAEWWEHHILQMDYDDKLLLPELVREVKRLQERFGLGTALVLESSPKKYNVICPHNVLTYWECLQVIHDTPCDPLFKQMRMLYRQINIRVSAKKGHAPHVKAIVARPAHNTVRYAEACNGYARALLASIEVTNA